MPARKEYMVVMDHWLFIEDMSKQKHMCVFCAYDSELQESFTTYTPSTVTLKQAKMLLAEYINRPNIRIVKVGLYSARK